LPNSMKLGALNQR